MDGLDERGIFACHDHIDGVEVFFTAKAPGQVGFWICGRLKLTAERAEEPEMAFAGFGRHFESLRYQGIDGDVIAQLKEFVWGKAFHGSSSSWLSNWVAGLYSRGPKKRAQGVHAIIPMGKPIGSSFAITVKDEISC
jgi:hypothetical protein